jgi:hypothetical protein
MHCWAVKRPPLRTCGQRLLWAIATQSDRDKRRLSRSCAARRRSSTCWRWPILQGHTAFLGGAREEFAWNLALKFYSFEEGLFVVAADPKYREIVGAQVLQFDETPTERAAAALVPLISHDNEMWIKETVPFRLRSLPLLHGLGLISEAHKVVLTIKPSRAIPSEWRFRQTSASLTSGRSCLRLPVGSI